MSWKKRSQEEIKATVFDAIDKNTSYTREHVLGVPASYLDPKVFSQDNSMLKDAPFLSALVNNPNHIGCHTIGASESFFKGTHAIERAVISICSEAILKAEENSIDGYVASGGTEANLQAMWIYRNFFRQTFNAGAGEIAILCSSDSHYSMPKAANVLNLSIYQVPVEASDRSLQKECVEEIVEQAWADGVRYVIVVANMMTTIFGSVDDLLIYIQVLEERSIPFKVHVDGAFGGFYYPFSNPENQLNFANKYVDSVTLDAHKMAQAPYGTGIFLIRKGYMQFANTKEASYVEGEDSTLIGSRSGANAVSIWMILSKYGPNEWMEKIFILQKRTDWLCTQLDDLGVVYYRNPYSNIVTMEQHKIAPEIAEKFGLVPDKHTAPEYYKIVVMDHVTIEKLEFFLDALRVSLD